MAIIQAGNDMLEDHPRADMAGFVACGLDLERQGKYAKRRQAELLGRQAIRNREKVYDGR